MTKRHVVLRTLKPKPRRLEQKLFQKKMSSRQGPQSTKTNSPGYPTSTTNSRFLFLLKTFYQGKLIHIYDRKLAESLGHILRLRVRVYIVKSRSNGSAVTESTSPLPNGISFPFFFFFLSS